jgi:hypothetical protein
MYSGRVGALPALFPLSDWNTELMMGLEEPFWTYTGAEC